MARVFVTTFTNMPGRMLDSFRQGFIDALVREGNDVLVFRTNEFLVDCQISNKISPSINQAELLSEIVRFEPDIVFSMNHSGMFEGLADSLDCPICIWLLDGPAYLIDSRECRRQRQRYYMLIPVRAFRGDLKDGFGFNDKLIHYVPFASDFQARDVETEHNIVFVGTPFVVHYLQEFIQRNIDNREIIGKVRKLIGSYRLNRDQVFSERLKECGISDLLQDDFGENHVLDVLAINNRIETLATVQPLGLSLFGNPEWIRVMPFSVELALSYNPRLVVTKSDLESIYNSSLVNLNISHAQARGGLPWRVFDIMACNGVLVSDYQEDLKQLFGNVELPIYTSPTEARDLCATLLKDKSRRSYLVQASQEMIQSSHRFINRIQAISEIVGKSLCLEKQGSVRYLHPQAFPVDIDASPKTSSLNLDTDREVERESAFLLQLFQSDNLEFYQSESILANVIPSIKGRIRHDFKLSDSKAFLRLDIGEHFSKHKDFVVKIGLYGFDESLSKTIDLKNEIIASHQFSWIDNSLLCGFDAYCVFENPFPGRSIAVMVETTIEASVCSWAYTASNV